MNQYRTQLKAERNSHSLIRNYGIIFFFVFVATCRVAKKDIHVEKLSIALQKRTQ